MKKTERLDALNILVSLFQEKGHLTKLFQENNSLSPLSKEICFGVCRYYYKLEIIANHLLAKKPKDITIWTAILIGIYQLHFLNIPDYAVVKETVDLVNKLNKTWAKGLVNAILRKYCREQEDITEKFKNNEMFVYSHPAWLIKKVKQNFPSEWENILKANNQHPPMTLRVNNSLIQTSEYLTKLQNTEIDGLVNTIAPASIILNKPIPVSDLPGFADGLVSVQDMAAQLAVELLDLQPNLNVLDACCAPGGKTCHILESEPNLASCLAFDIEENRLKQVKQNLARLKLSATVLQADGLTPESWWNGILFDRILLDAPCSATGVIRRHPDIKLLRTTEEINLIKDLQQQLLQSLWPLLAPGGKMVYATCSIMPEENDEQIELFLQNNSDCHCEIVQKPWGNKNKFGYQILPGKNNMDGFFYSVLIKNKI